jgi:hypothetical protein
MGDHIETFDEKFAQGDVFGFPYDKKHMVKEIIYSSGGLDSRVSPSMPASANIKRPHAQTATSACSPNRGAGCFGQDVLRCGQRPKNSPLRMALGPAVWSAVIGYVR